jgi:hypothetical protein
MMVQNWKQKTTTFFGLTETEQMIQFTIIYNPIAMAKWQAVDSSGKVWKSHIYKRGVIDWINAQNGMAPTKQN